MALAIVMGTSMFPVIIWALLENNDQKRKEQMRHYENPSTLF